jgi:hypothetical protein
MNGRLALKDGLRERGAHFFILHLDDTHSLTLLAWAWLDQQSLCFAWHHGSRIVIDCVPFVDWIAIVTKHSCQELENPVDHVLLPLVFLAGGERFLPQQFVRVLEFIEVGRYS